MSLVRTLVLRYNGTHIQKFLSSLNHRQIHTYTNWKIVIYMTFQKQLTLWYISHIIKGDYMTKFKLIAYEKENGEIPVEEFLDSINPKMRAKIFGLLSILQEKEILIAKNRRKDFIERWMKDENI